MIPFFLLGLVALHDVALSHPQMDINGETLPAVWDCTIQPKEFTKASLEEVLAYVQKSSISADPQGKGVIICLLKNEELKRTSPESLSGVIGNRTIAREIEVTARLDGLDYVFVGNVVILAPTKEIPRLLVLSGTCRSAKTKHPIKDLSLSVFPRKVQAVIDPRGSYLAALEIRWPYSGNGMVELTKTEGDPIQINVTAPGFKSRSYTLDSSKLNFNTCNSLNIELEEIDATIAH